MDEKLKIVKPYGHLYANNQDFLLIKPYPIEGDSWEGDNCYRFLVTPSDPIAVEQRGSVIYPIYDYPRHVVTNSFTIEYMDYEEIHMVANEEVVIEKNKEIEENDEKDEFPF